MSKRSPFTLAPAAGAANPLAAADPAGQSRTYAIPHASIHGASNAIDARYGSYAPGPPQDPGASAAAAIPATSRRLWGSYYSLSARHLTSADSARKRKKEFTS
jgi:hypothetical protein